MSDVYAMGGEVLFALQIAAWPEDAPIAQLERVFAGAVDTVREAGGVRMPVYHTPIASAMSSAASSR